MPDNGYYHQVPHFTYWPIDVTSIDWGWCPEDDSAIQYAQNDEAAPRAFIDNLRLHDGSGIHHGLKYALALLDPTSRDEFLEPSEQGLVPAEFADRPANWADANTGKYIVLMSEGVVGTEWTPTEPLNPINETVALQDQTDLPADPLSSDITNIADFYQQCDLAKENEVEIFAIAFEASADGKEQLLNCASSASHFFDVDGADLSSIFSNVGGAITQLRLTK